MKDITTTEGELLIPDQNIVAKAFESDLTIVQIVEVIEKECRAVHLSVLTLVDRKAIASLAYKIARSKTAADAIGKSLTEEATKKIAEINGRRNTVKSRLDTLRDEIRKPLDDWEAADDLRKQAIRDRIANAFFPRALPAALSDLRAIQDATSLIELDETWAEFLEEAAKAKDNFLRYLTGKIIEAERLEAQEAELARLRAAEAQRQRQDAERAERERVAAAEKAESDVKIAALQAQLEAMQQQPLPEPVGQVFAGNPITPVTAALLPITEFVSVQSVEISAPSQTFVIEAEIAAAVLALIEGCETHEDAAEMIAEALLMDEIPYVQVVM